ncbi:MAG: hypothetical protein ACI88L_000407 [Candidatus Paceibacteria bacterium]|jgi:hypothetical protein
MKNKNISLIVVSILVVFLFFTWHIVFALISPKSLPKGQKCDSNMGEVYKISATESESVSSYLVNGKIEYGCGGGFDGMANTKCEVVSKLEFGQCEYINNDLFERARLLRKIWF